MTEKTPLLSVRDLCVGYRGDHPVVSNVHFDVHAGEILALVGPNGAGKTTLLHTISGDLSPLAGEVNLCGDNLAQLSAIERARHMAVMATQRAQTELLTCQDAVELGRYPYTGRTGSLQEIDRTQVRTCMELTRTWKLRNRDLTELSDGQRQRVMLARALCQEPDVLLLDEPTAFLDVRYKVELLNLVRTLARKQKFSVIASLHELDLVQQFADRVLCLKDGQVLAYGSPETTLTQQGVHDLFGFNEDASDTGSFDPLLGSIEMPRPIGKPRVFVIVGGCAGTPAFRMLQRAGIPFACGILHEGDVDWALACNIASAIVCVPAFDPVDETAIEKAKALLAGCEVVLDCLDSTSDIPAPSWAQELAGYANSHKLPLVHDPRRAVDILS